MARSKNHLLSTDDNPSPHDVPLEDLKEALAPTTLSVLRECDTLIVQHENLTTRVEVMPPANREADYVPISAVVTIKTLLPEEFTDYLNEPGSISNLNSMASLGAVTQENGQCFIGSRLTIYEGEDAWNIQFPLILFTIVASVDSILGATRRILTNVEPQDGPSEWTESDLEFVQSQLSGFCVCNGGGMGLTAEFGLKSDAVSALAGHHETALWQIMADQPHPELGGGLFCLLQLPHQMEDENALRRVIDELNRMEMAPHDLPPHFGAWCQGKLGNNPAYVSFLPNALHSADGIAFNVSIWAMHRARWADAMLVALGAR